MRVLLVLALAAAACAGGCGGSSDDNSGQMAAAQPAAKPAPAAAVPAPVRSATVDIASFKYKPATIAVKKGGRVRWTNSDSAAHTATADDRSFDTQTIGRGAVRMVTFTTPGTVAYHCDFHPFMKATVVVR
jgi:plastocyanin